MDLLPCPTSPIPVDSEPYLPWAEKWDGGPFLSFDECKEVAYVPKLLQQQLSDIQEVRWPTIDEARNIGAFYQTWFFFGLLAEFYSLNQMEDGTLLRNETEISGELDSLYDRSV
ncbi:hypothetical protein B0T25DRAFT_535998 [Lasiosphaeria hispida]|uniref:Uncharacterized protein n=1 Tax=Lasiosphaeria hispida TaxID=260671 RepID=A0AAJ0HST8_9PEZI|nr:hypothetical protein B0T25DRAFT_535998 [Lasiosphaeria hispida]